MRVKSGTRFGRAKARCIELSIERQSSETRLEAVDIVDRGDAFRGDLQLCALCSRQTQHAVRDDRGRSNNWIQNSIVVHSLDDENMVYVVIRK